MTTSLAPLPVQRFVDNNGNALTGGKLFTYTAGTSTKQTTYTDSTGGTPNTNPIILNSRGECQVWLTQNIAYKLVLSPSTDTDPPTNAFWTVDNIQPGLGAIASGSLLGNSSGSSAVPTAQTLGSGLSLGSGALSLVPRGYISGLTLSNDATSPNTVLDISAGFCVDSTNTVPITLTSFTKSVSGSWVAGSGNAGMGVSLSVTANTWYHVYAIINGGSPDVYFDTSASAANSPPGTTAFRRIGSMYVTPQTQIDAFFQFGDDFLYSTELTSLSQATLSTAPTAVSVSVPPGVFVTANIKVNAGSSLAFSVLIGSPFLSGVIGNSLTGPAGGLAAGQLSIKTDTSQNIKIWSTVTSTTASVYTSGWTDTRGRFL